MGRKARSTVAEKQRSRESTEAEKQRSKEIQEQQSREAEKQRSRKSREAMKAENQETKKRKNRPKKKSKNKQPSFCKCLLYACSLMAKSQRTRINWPPQVCCFAGLWGSLQGLAPRIISSQKLYVIRLASSCRLGSSLSMLLPTLNKA